MTEPQDHFEDETYSVFGRPSKYPSGDEEVRKLHIEILDLGRQGKSLVQIAAALEIGRTTLYRWMDEKPDFKNTIKAAQDAAQAVWEDMGFKMARTGEGSASAFIFQMKNRFHADYKDHKAVDHSSSDGSMTPPQQTFYQLPDNGRDGEDDS